MSPSLPLVPGSTGTSLGLASTQPIRAFLGSVIYWGDWEVRPWQVCPEGYQAHGNSQGIDALEEEPWAQLFWNPDSLDLQPRKQ